MRPWTECMPSPDLPTPLQDRPFGALLRQFRVAAGLSQEELAVRAGLSVRGISDLERGVRRQPQPGTLRLLVAALGLAPNEQAVLEAAVDRRRRPLDPQVNRQPLVPQRHAEPAPSHLPPNLPVPPTTLIGRHQEVGSVVALLRRRSARLVTLLGPGGVGKTRLALAAAAQLARDYEHGVYFVDLASIDDAALVAPTIGPALGVVESATGSIVQALEAIK